ncbi:MAG: hypothetical protein AB7P04_05820 [Bacteriovoracia bacterium]
MQPEQTNGTWLPLMEYSIKQGISLSTLRRYIKANKIQHKLEDGRYLIWDADASGVNVSRTASDDSVALKAKLFQLEKELQKANQEIAELKTLVALYEEKIPQKFSGLEPSFERQIEN